MRIISRKNLTPLLALICISFIAIPAEGARSSRPFTGIGILIIRPLSPARSIEKNNDFPVYREPGVARVATISGNDLPVLSPALKTAGEEKFATVVDKRGSWLNIIYAEDGRSGWIAQERSWDFLPWREFLKGRPVQLLRGIRKKFSIIHQQPSDSAPAVASPGKGLPIRVVDTNEDWCKVILGAGAWGWLRWRDGDGRLLITVDRPVAAQNH